MVLLAVVLTVVLGTDPGAPGAAVVVRLVAVVVAVDLAPDGPVAVLVVVVVVRVVEPEEIGASQSRAVTFYTPLPYMGSKINFVIIN